MTHTDHRLQAWRDWVISVMVMVFLASSPAHALSIENDDEDERGTFQASFFAAESIDTFMADDAAQYLNLDETSDSRSRLTGGIETEIRVDFGDPDDDNDTFQVWLLADITYGVRSSDFNCGEEDPNSELAICKSLDTATAPDRTLYAIREATSIEGGLGIRLEYPLWGTARNARLYIRGRASFVAVEEQPDDFLEVNHLALGILSPRAKFKNSYLEVGRVRNRLFRVGETDRWRIDGRLSVPIGKTDEANFRFFVRTTVEVDIDDGPDSAITSLGISYDPAHIFAR